MWRLAKLAEDKKFKADELSSQPISCKHGGDHVFVPFAMEDGGTLGAHAHALLKTLAEHAVSAGRHISPDSRSPLSPSMQVSLWMQRWQNRLSTWLHMLAFHSRFSVFTGLQGFSLLVSSLLDPLVLA